MARKRKPVSKRRLLGLARRQWMIIAGVAAVAVLATVLILVTAGAPDDDEMPGDAVLATVNGEEITADEVSRLQQRLLRWDEIVLEDDEALEQLIVDSVLYQEAERRGYHPTLQETEREVRTALFDMGISVEELHARLAEEGLSYMEYLEERRVQLAIAQFVDDAVEVPEITEEEAMEYYQGYRELFKQLYPDLEPLPYDEIRDTAIAILEEERREVAASIIVAQLRRQAEIVYTQSE